MRGALVCALLVLLVAAPLVEGAALTLVPQLPALPLVPDGAPAPITLTATYTCATGELLAGDVVLHLDPPVATPPAGLVITGPESLAIPAETCQGPTSKPWRQEIAFQVSATQNAAGEQMTALRFHGRVDKGTAVAEAKADTEGVLSVAWTGVLSAAVPATIQEAGPQKQVVYEVQLSNEGNALNQVTFEVQGGGPGWNAVAPSPVILGSRQRGDPDNRQVVQLVVQTPYHEGWNNNETTLQLVMTPHSIRDGTVQGPAITVAVLARVRGIYCSSDATPECKKALDEMRADCAGKLGAGNAADGCDKLAAASAAKSSPAAGLLVALALLGAAMAARRRA